TSFSRDWSSDVCSSDLLPAAPGEPRDVLRGHRPLVGVGPWVGQVGGGPGEERPLVLVVLPATELGGDAELVQAVRDGGVPGGGERQGVRRRRGEEPGQG